METLSPPPWVSGSRPIFRVEAVAGGVLLPLPSPEVLSELDESPPQPASVAASRPAASEKGIFFMFFPIKINKTRGNHA